MRASCAAAQRAALSASGAAGCQSRSSAARSSSSSALASLNSSNGRVSIPRSRRSRRESAERGCVEPYRSAATKERKTSSGAVSVVNGGGGPAVVSTITSLMASDSPCAAKRIVETVLHRVGGAFDGLFQLAQMAHARRHAWECGETLLAQASARIFEELDAGPEQPVERIKHAHALAG